MAFTSIIDEIQTKSAQTPKRTAVTFLNEDLSAHPLTFEELNSRISNFAVNLEALGIHAGELVLLILPQSIALVEAFLGCLRFGAVPTVLAYIDNRMDVEVYIKRLLQLISVDKPGLIVTSDQFKAELEKFSIPETTQIIGIGQIIQRGKAHVYQSPQPDDVAFVQYSSGTTGNPKGVVLTQQSIMKQINALADVIELRNTDRMVSWLPLHHDLGLVAGLLLPIVYGIPLVLMSPYDWVRVPSMLFYALNEFKGTLAFMPNFAFSHCALNIRKRDLDGIDLSGMRLFINGGEPIYIDTLRRFLKRFQQYGVTEGMLSTGYGLAEVSGAVSLSTLREFPDVDYIDKIQLSQQKRARSIPASDELAIPIVSSGKILPEVEVRIIDDAGKRLLDREVGEIAIRGNFVFRGYYGQEQSATGIYQDGWLYTGDYGYIADGNLFICGRKKDIMIIGGENFYPEFFEEAILDIPQIRPGRIVVFGVSDEKLGTEKAVMVCELKQTLSEKDKIAVIHEIRERVLRSTGVVLGDVQLVSERWVIKTTSGKKARNLNREKYISEFIKLDEETIT